MTKKSWTPIAIILLGLIAAVVYYFDQNPAGSNGKDSRLGKKISPKDLATLVDEIRIAKGKDTLYLKKQSPSLWLIKSGDEFPVQSKKIAELVDKFGELTLVRLVSEKESEFASLGMNQASTLSFWQNGKELSSWSFGETRTGGGQYIKQGNEPKVYLASDSISLDLSQYSWEKTDIVHIEEKLVKAVSIEPAVVLKKQSFGAERLGADKDFQVVTPKIDSESLDAEKLKALAKIGEHLAFTKRYSLDFEGAKTAFASPTRTRIILFDGITYEIALGHSQNPKESEYFIKVFEYKEGKLTSNPMNQYMNRSIFAVSRDIGARFEKGLEELKKFRVGEKKK